MAKPQKEDGSDIFKTLFGASSHSGSNPLSLFADSAFRRKPHAAAQHSSSKLASDPEGETTLGGSGYSGENKSRVIQLKPRKRDREKRQSSESAGSDSEGGKKRKKEDGETEALEKKEKKKRKRDEIEEEYEARKFGLVKEGEEEAVEPRRVTVGEKRKAVDDLAETMVVSAEAYDDEDKLQRTVFVGNLPIKIKKKTLMKEFKCFGDIESVRIRSVPILDTKIPRKGAVIQGKINESIDSVHAYIVFKDEKSAQAALSRNMNEVGGNHIRVDRACPPRKKLKGELHAPLYDNKRTVFVGNLPFDAKDEELYQLFGGFNQLESCIEAVRVIRDPNSSMGKGIAYVLFKTREAANWLVKKKNIKLRDRILRLCHSKPEATPSKRKASPLPRADVSPSKRAALGSREDKQKRKASALSYQGLRAGKSGVQKKSFPTRKRNAHGSMLSNGEKERQPKVHKSKRPAVAARKAASIGGSSSSTKVTGKKHKLEGGTPGSARRNKRARRAN